MSNNPNNNRNRPPGYSGGRRRIFFGPPNPKRKRKKKRVRYQYNQSGTERYNSYLEEDKYKEYVRSKNDEKETESEQAKKEARESVKGHLSIDIPKDSVKDENNPYIISENEEIKKAKKAVILKKSFIIFVCLIAAVGINIFSFRVPFTPRIISVDFSAFPELLVGLAVNPVAGIAVVLAKSALYYLINPGSIASIPGKIILDSVFIIITWLLFRAFSKSKTIQRKNEERQKSGLEEKTYSGSTILLAGIIGSVIVSIVSVFTLKYLLLPILYSRFQDAGYTPEAVLADYRWAYDGVCRLIPFVKMIIPSLDSINTGIIMYNVPLSIFKYGVCAVLTALVYSPIEEFLKRK